MRDYKQKVEEEERLDAIRVELTKLKEDESRLENEITAALGSLDALQLSHEQDK